MMTLAELDVMREELRRLLLVMGFPRTWVIGSAAAVSADEADQVLTAARCAAIELMQRAIQTQAFRLNLLEKRSGVLARALEHEPIGGFQKL